MTSGRWKWMLFVQLIMLPLLAASGRAGAPPNWRVDELILRNPSFAELASAIMDASRTADPAGQGIQIEIVYPDWAQKPLNHDYGFFAMPVDELIDMVAVSHYLAVDWQGNTVRLRSRWVIDPAESVTLPVSSYLWKAWQNYTRQAGYQATPAQFFRRYCAVNLPSGSICTALPEQKAFRITTDLTTLEELRQAVEVLRIIPPRMRIRAWLLALGNSQTFSLAANGGTAENCEEVLAKLTSAAGNQILATHVSIAEVGQPGVSRRSAGKGLISELAVEISPEFAWYNGGNRLQIDWCLQEENPGRKISYRTTCLLQNGARMLCRLGQLRLAGKNVPIALLLSADYVDEQDQLLDRSKGPAAAFWATAPLPKPFPQFLQQSILPTVYLEEVPVIAIVQLLAGTVRERDPNRSGFGFAVVLPNFSQPVTVTMAMNNVPQSELIRYICLIAGLRYRVGENSIHIIDGWVPFHGLELSVDVATADLPRMVVGMSAGQKNALPAIEQPFGFVIGSDGQAQNFGLDIAEYAGADFLGFFGQFGCGLSGGSIVCWHPELNLCLSRIPPDTRTILAQLEQMMPVMRNSPSQVVFLAAVVPLRLPEQAAMLQDRRQSSMLADELSSNCATAV